MESSTRMKFARVAGQALDAHMDATASTFLRPRDMTEGTRSGSVYGAAPGQGRPMCAQGTHQPTLPGLHARRRTRNAKLTTNRQMASRPPHPDYARAVFHQNVRDWSTAGQDGQMQAADLKDARSLIYTAPKATSFWRERLPDYLVQRR